MRFEKKLLEMAFSVFVDRIASFFTTPIATLYKTSPRKMLLVNNLIMCFCSLILCGFSMYVSALFYKAISDENNEVIFEIKDNQIKVNSGAYDISSIGRNWKIRSSEKIIADIAFDLPYSIRISRLNLISGEWELRTDKTSIKILRNSTEVSKITGYGHISGPCFVQCNTETGKALFKDLTIDGRGRSPVPPGSLTLQLKGGATVFGGW